MTLFDVLGQFYLHVMCHYEN